MTNFLWWRDGIIYQVYPRSFADSNADGVGDLQGIISRLDYLSDLGIDAIWFSPLNPSPDVDFGYDVSDYKDIDPKYGTLEDFDLLICEAHRRNLRIIMDLVLNHTSDQHPWFKESRSSRDNPKRDWYIWKEHPSGKIKPPNNWQSVFGGKAWEFDPDTGQYYYHMFCKEQPDLNWRNPEVRAEMMSTFRFWLDRGVDGFRLDVFNQYFKDIYFRNNPYKPGIRPFDCQVHQYDTDQPEMIEVVTQIRELLDQYDDRYVVGETFMASQQRAAEYCAPERLHAAFDFSLLRCPWNPACFLQSILRWNEVLAPEAWPNNVLNNHDTKRSASRFHTREDDRQLKVAAAMLLTLRGTPFLYYGEEIGMRNVRLQRSELRDPIGIRYWPVPVGRDGCRSPMQWDGSDGAGFSSGKPWMKLHPGYHGRNVDAQRKQPNSLFNFYKRLIELRKEQPVLQKGMFIPLIHEPQRVLAYIRRDADSTILVALNFARRSSRLALGAELACKKWQLLLTTDDRKEVAINKGWIRLKGYEVCILKLIE